jgi:hypothetical protein
MFFAGNFVVISVVRLERSMVGFSGQFCARFLEVF